MEPIKAIRKGEALVAEMDSFLADEQQFHLWWLGQSGFLLQWNGNRVLLDPYLSDSLTKKYAFTDKPHVRMSEMVVAPDLLKGISVVTSSHNHTDHLDAETLQPILFNNPGMAMVIPEANRDFVADRIQCDRNFPLGLNDGQSIESHGFRFHGLPAKHNEIERDEWGQCRFMGYIIEFGGFKIYHSGDTLWFDEMPGLIQPWQVDLAILPINGNRPERRVAGNLDAVQAVRLARSIEARWAIPCHYDLFEFNTADVREFVLEAERLGQPYQVLNVGGHFGLGGR